MKKIMIDTKQDYLNHRKAVDLMTRYACLDDEEQEKKEKTIVLLSTVLADISATIDFSDIEGLSHDIDARSKSLAILLCQETLDGSENPAETYHDTISQALELARIEHKELFEFSKKLTRIFHDEELTITREQLAKATLEDIESRFKQTMRSKEHKQEFNDELKNRNPKK